jgi:2-dehydropantoate 2-reductase
MVSWRGMGQTLAIVGVGAIGGAVAADLADLGRHHLTLCTRSAFDRLEVRHPGGTSTIEQPPVTAPAGIGRPVDWVLLATKAHHSAGARPWLDALCAPGTRVAVLQNGVDHVDRIAPLVPPETAIVPVVVQLPAERDRAGRVVQSRDGLLLVPDSPDGRAFAALFEGARTAVRATADFRAQAWWKLLSNAALGGVAALAIRDNSVARDPGVRAVIVRLMDEIVAVARAEGVALPDDAPAKVLDRVLEAAGTHWSSISADRRAGRPMEWAVRNAVVGRIGRRHGVPTPWNDAITALLRVADEGVRG